MRRVSRARCSTGGRNRFHAEHIDKQDVSAMVPVYFLASNQGMNVHQSAYGYVGAFTPLVSLPEFRFCFFACLSPEETVQDESDVAFWLLGFCGPSEVSPVLRRLRLGAADLLTGNATS